jgi:hypothetical protein
MEITMKRAVFAVAYLTLSGLASAGTFGPSTYDECILANMKGVGSDVAARAIAASCAKQFPPKTPQERSAPRTAATNAPAGAKSDSFTDFKSDAPK